MTDFNSNKRKRVTHSLQSGINKVHDLYKEDAILIWDRPRYRSPNLTRFYRLLASDNTLKYNFIFVPDISNNLEYICKRYLNGKPPKFLYTGFTKNKLDTITKRYIIYNNISLLCETGDANLFLKHSKGFFKANTVRNMNGLDIKALIHRSNVGIKNLKEIKEKYPIFDSTKLLHIPWSVDLESFNNTYENKDIDIAYMCTIEPKFPPHKNRVKSLDIIKHIKNNNPNMSVVIKNKIAYAKYKELLKRSKIFIALGSIRAHPFSQKYIEGMASKCLLICDPISEDIPFNFDEHFIEFTYDIEDIENKINYYIHNDNERHKIVNKAYDILSDNYTDEAIKHLFIEKLKSVIE